MGELLVHAMKDVENSVVFVHPTCGPTQPGDIGGPTRIKTYEVMQDELFYKKWAGDSFRWSYLPYSMKMAGPKEALQHMIIRKNFGATHFIIGRDMADYPNMVFVGHENGNARGYSSDVEAKTKGLKISKLSGTEFRQRLR